MKANAPEKIYLQQYDENTLICLNKWNVSEEWSNKPCNEKVATNIEYIRKDAFIEKVKEFLSKESNIPLWDDRGGNFGCDTPKLVENFIKYIEEE